MKKRLGLLVCLMLVYLIAPAQSQDSPSAKPSETVLMVPLSLCEEQLGLLEQTAKAELDQQNNEWQARLTKLENDFAEQLRRACEDAAATAVKPVLVELAGAKAARDMYATQMRSARWAARLGWGFGIVSIAILWVHFFVPQTLTVP